MAHRKRPRYRFNSAIACQGKVKHRSYLDAENFLKHKPSFRRNEGISGLVDIYKCLNNYPYVHWHIGKSVMNNHRRRAPYKRQKRYNMEDV